MAGPLVREVDDELEGRAAVFGALGEPVRLAIVESLLLSDLTPQDVVEALSIRSNLLAHHLNVLEAAGLLTRVRSGGDGRRRYLRLSGAISESLRLTPESLQADEVLFVCAQDMGLSQVASRLWARHSPIPGRAAAHRPSLISPLTTAIATRMDLGELDARTPQVVNVPSSNGVVVTLSDIARERATLPTGPVLHWSLPPLSTAKATEQAVAEIGRRVVVLSQAIAA